MKHPLAIFVQLTTSCNAECINCPHPFTYGRRGQHTKGHMEHATWKELLRQIRGAKYSGQVGLYLHHEPLIVKSLFEKIRDVNDTTEAFVVLSTNGALLTAENRRRLIDAQPRQVHVNINSADPAQYEAMMVGLTHQQTFVNTRAFVCEVEGRFNVEINCPVMPGVDTDELVRAFPGVKVNVDFWANSRGGLLDGVSAAEKGSRFKLEAQCQQPDVNFNILWDGSVIVCCMDWAHTSRDDFPSIMKQNLFDIYNGRSMRDFYGEMQEGNYSRYAMCGSCAEEMGFDVRARASKPQLVQLRP